MADTKFHVVAVKKHATKENWRRVTLEGADGIFEAICFGREADTLVPGAALPEGWNTEPGKFGPVLRYPRKEGEGRGGGPAASWRNTEEGFKYEQMRMDRRTAIMQAVALRGLGTTSVDATTLSIADELFAWLRRE